MSKEGLVRLAVEDSYVPILSDALHEYPERYPSVCGPVGIVLPRSPWFLDTGIPLQLGGDNERFELEIGIFDPGGSSRYKPGDHTHMRYYTGDGRVLYIDFVHPLLWGRAPMLGRPLVEMYREDEIDQALAERHRLFPFSNALAWQHKVNLWYGQSVPVVAPMTDYRDMQAAMHDNRAFDGVVTLNSGHIVDTRTFWGERTRRLLQAVGGHALGGVGTP